MTPTICSSYACEQLFPSMKPSKTKLRPQLTDDRLKNVMLFASSNLPLEIQKLSNVNQHQISHSPSRCAINVLCVVFCGSFINCENQDSVRIKFHQFAFNKVMNGEGNGIVCGKSEGPARPCRVYVWPAARKRLPTAGLKAASHRIWLRLAIRFIANGSFHTGFVVRIRLNFLGFAWLPADLTPDAGLVVDGVLAVWKACLPIQAR